ncbi:MAG: EAL domain-containing protein [Candidatus Aenigmatarchaeota archaeon]
MKQERDLSQPNLRFSVCPHDTERGIKKWVEFGNRIEKLTGIKVLFLPIESFEEEHKRLQEDFFHMYYASPLRQIELLEKEYVPLAKFRNQEDKLLLISKYGIPETREITVALPVLEYTIYGLSYLDISRVKTIYTRGFYDVVELVQKDKADIGIIYADTWVEIINENDIIKQDIKIIKVLKVNTHHTFMVHKSVWKLLKPILLSFPEIEGVTSEDIEKTRQLNEKIKLFYSYWETKSISNSVTGSPFVGIFIFGEKLIYANEYMSKLTGFSKEELLNFKSIDFFNRIKDKNIIRNIFYVLKENYNGEALYYESVPFCTKDMTSIYVDIFFRKTIYAGSYFFIGMFVDRTKRKKIETFLSLIQQLNETVIHSVVEEEFFDKFMSLLINFGFKFASITKSERDKDTVVTLYTKGEPSCFFWEMKNLPKNEIPEEIASKRKEILVISDCTLLEEEKKSLTRTLLKFNLFSFAIIPIEKNGQIEYFLSLYSDEKNYFREEVSEILTKIKKDIEFALRKMEELRKNLIIGQALDSSKSLVIITEENGVITYVNNYVSEVYGYSKEEVLGQKPSIFKSGHHDKDFYKNLWQTILSGKEFSSIIINRKKNGELFYIDATIYPVKLPGNITKFILVGKDITKERTLSKEIYNIRFYDFITGLINKEGLINLYEGKLQPDLASCLLLIDINNFSYVNESYGFYFGDNVLKAVANGLKGNFNEQVVLARTGGDEFAIFLKDIKEANEILQVLNKTKNLFNREFYVNGIPLTLSINVGVSIYPNDGKNIREIYEKAQLALKEAKSLGSGEMRLYNKKLEEQAKNFIFLDSLIQRAIKENLFLFYYQPYFRLKDLSLSGFEALVRIKDKNGKLYSPDFFISFLENSNYLPVFEHLAFEEIKATARKWGLNVSMNVAARTFKNKEFLNLLTNIENDVKITYEITERILIEQIENVNAFIRDLENKQNIKIAIDDFGTGYSSLGYIKNINIDIIKIDISFIKDMLINEKSKAIVKTIVELAENLGAESIAEGVENQQQLNFLRQIGCVYAQGYFLGKPMPKEDIIRLYKLPTS